MNRKKYLLIGACLFLLICGNPGDVSIQNMFLTIPGQREVFSLCGCYMIWKDGKSTSAALDYSELLECENEQAYGLEQENQLAKNMEQEQQKAIEENAVETEMQQEDKVPDPDNTQVAVIPEKVQEVSYDQLCNFDFLKSNFYQVDCSTAVDAQQLNADKFMQTDVSVDKNEAGPQILIYHTHSQEGYLDSDLSDPNQRVVGVGGYLTQLLEEKGWKVLHHTGEYDVGDRDHAYSNVAPTLQQLMADNPQIQLVIDLHRDGVAETTRLVTEQNGKSMAKVMFFNGLSRAVSGDEILTWDNPYVDTQLALSFQMQLCGAEYYPGFNRKIYLKGYRYNMHYCAKSMLIEVGAQTNTLQEAMNAMEPLANIIDKVLSQNL